MISICVILAAPCRLLVPMQSLPVSPPPMTNTCLPLAFMRSSLLNACPPRTRFCWASVSNAECMPLRAAPRDIEVACLWGSRADAVSVEAFRQVFHVDGSARLEGDAFGCHDVHATVYDGLVEFEVRDAEA